MSATVDVVVVAYGAADLLEECLAGLAGTLPVLIVDNSSDPAVEAIARRREATYVDPGRNLGFAGGVNLGLSRRPDQGADVLLLNPDATITSQGVMTLHRFLHSRPDLACVAPVQVDPVDGESARVAWPFPSPLGAWVEAIGLGTLRRRPDFMIGSVLLLRAEALADVGPFDEQFFLYAEEIDWERRAHDRGWQAALVPTVVATHVGAGTGGDAYAREVHFQASHERYVRKHFGTTGWRRYRTATIAGALARALVLPGERSRKAAARFHLYRKGPCRVEASLGDGANGSRPT
ncbi:MAG TPA: glycosyltransferase [Acidimicrobiales bacterium]